MNRMLRLLAVLLCAVLLSGCYKGDGTENYTPHRQTAPAQDDPFAAEKDAQFQDIGVDPNAATDTPFPFDAASVTEPQGDIVIALLYDNTRDKYNHTQAINYFDKYGNTYRYRKALDLEGDWLSVLKEDLAASPTVVNRMSEPEIRTLWYLAAHAEEYAGMELASQDAGVDVQGVYWLYVIDSAGQPVLLARYDDTARYVASSEVTAFLNWFRYFYHGSMVFGS